VDGLLALAREEAGRGNTAQAYRTCREARVLADQLGDAQVVERVLVSTVSLCLDQAGAHYDYGVYLMKLEQPEAALRSFKQAVGLAPQWVPAYLGMAETAIRTGQFAAAQIALQRALRIDPGNREATWGLAVLYDKYLRRPDEALTAYRDFLARYDSDSRSAAARARIVVLQRHLVDAPAPVPEIRAPAREPEPPAARLQIARPRVRNHKAAVEAYNRGTIFQAREDWDQAIFFYTRALEQDDTFALAYYNLGKVYQTQNETDLAIEAYEASISLQPRHLNSRFNVALLYREQGRNDRAVQQLQGILQFEPNHARAHYLLGLVYSEDRRTREQAVAAFQRFLRLSPNDRAAPAVRQWLAESP
jgi:tetratricopeptide (TPR) repeat protein